MNQSRLGKKMTSEKSFGRDFSILLEHLCQGKPFAFNRFSDGELYILQDKELILGEEVVKIGEKVEGSQYQKEDHKHFDPDAHAFYRDRLVDSFRYCAEGYYKGLSCRCCVGQEHFQWQLDFLKGYDENLTWANLLLNANYPRFIRQMLPLFNQYPVVFICNEKADLSMLPFVVKDFRVGYNAMINDYALINDMIEWVAKSRIRGHLFLFSASSFSKMAIHQLYEAHPCNTYIDVGTTMNVFMAMRLDRTYLRSYWLKQKGKDLEKTCIW